MRGNTEIENLLHLSQPYKPIDIIHSKQRLIKQLGERNNLGNENGNNVGNNLGNGNFSPIGKNN